MNKKKIKNTDWKILICVILLLIIGLIALYSATTSSEFAEFKKQIIWILLGIPLFLIMYFIDYRVLARFSVVFYGISILLLIVVLFTSKINGASSWFNIGAFSLQPAEFAKIAVILFLAYMMSKLRRKSRKTNKQTNKYLKNYRNSKYSSCFNNITTRLWYSYSICFWINIYIICCRH